MNKTFYARSDFNKRTVVSHNNDFTFNLVTNLEVLIKSIPWVRLKLLQAKSNSLLFVIEVKDNDIEFLIKSNNFVRIVNTAPRKVCNVNQAVNATKVDEYTVRSDILNCSFKNLTLFKFSDDVFLLLLKFCFNKSLVRNDYILKFLINLNDLEFHCFTNEYVIVADLLNVDL